MNALSELKLNRPFRDEPETMKLVPPVKHKRSDDPNVAFTLRVNVGHRGLVTIRVWDNLGWDDAGRVKLTCEVTHDRKVVFPRGQLRCALHGTSDGIGARELILSLVGMAPDARGGEGNEYYEDYTPSQLEWVNRYHEEIGMVREFRYCDPETGFCKGDR